MCENRVGSGSLTFQNVYGSLVNPLVVDSAVLIPRQSHRFPDIYFRAYRRLQDYYCDALS